MSCERLYVCMTMDVERINAFYRGGPPTWEFAERSVRSYCGLLAEHGLPATLFVVPDTATHQGKMLREVAQETGAELGMHFHPEGWGDHYKNREAYDCLGGYSREEQHRMLAGALEQVTEGFGTRPEAFRPGNCSANDETFGVLADLGFTHGSVSQPGRAASSRKAVWKDACLDVHRAHGAFRMVAGDLDFIEVPIVSDQERSDHWTGVGDVRFEAANPAQVAKAVQQHVTRQVEEAVPLKHVCLFTHNTVNFWSAEESERGRRGVLEESISKIRDNAEELDLEVKGATIADVREAFLEAEQEVGTKG